MGKKIGMTITLDLAPDLETYLRAKAAREGQKTEEVARTLIAQAIRSDLQSQQSFPLNEYGIASAQAEELRAKFASFAEDWNQPEMDIYNDYDDAKARLDAKLVTEY